MNGITAPILNTVTAPLVLGDWGTNVYNYQQFYVTMVNSVLEESELLVTDKFLEEMSKQFYGNETAKTVISLFESSELTKKGEIDDNCAAVINELIALINQYLHTKKVSGRILNENGNGVRDSFVSVYFEDINGDTLIEATNTDEKGNYAVSYSVLSPEIPEEELSELGHKVGNLTFPPIETGTRGVKVIAKDASETYEVSSDIFFETSNNLTIDLTLPFKADDSVPDEMSLLEKKITTLLAERTEPEDDSIPLNLIHFIAKALSEDETIVRYYVLSNNYSVKVDDVNMKPLLYGIMRGSNISSIEALANLHNEQLLEYTKHAVNKNWIPNIANESIINEIIDEFKNSSTTFILDTKTETPENSKAYKILSYVFSDSLITEFLDYYYAQLPDGNFDFWKDDELVTNLPNFTSGDISSLKSIFTCALLSGSNPKLSNIFYTEGTEDFAGLSEEEWITFLEDQLTYEDPYFIIPDFIEGELPEDKVANYAAYLKLNVDGVFPTTAVKQQILKDTDDTFAYIAENINTFLENNSGFDILKTPLQYLTAEDTEFDFTDIEDKEDFLEELASLQRLNAVYSSYDTIKVLYSNNLKSAMDIISMPLNEFEALFEEPEAEILERSSFTPFSSTVPSPALIYNNAIGTSMYVQAVAMQFYTFYAEANMNQALGFTITPQVQADWRTLFGGVDFCNCQHCLSIFSPSAYLADMLNYLKQVALPAYEWLVDKRPDIPELLLTCKNTNIALPAIDLVNELLEDIVINVDGSNTDFPLVLAAHNTELEERVLRAVPEHINIDGIINDDLSGRVPYDVLKAAVYPWSAPYDYFKQQVVHYLDIVNLKPRQFVETYTDTQSDIAENTIDWACVYLGITKDTFPPVPPLPFPTHRGEYYIITDSDPATNRRRYYGLTRSFSSGAVIPNPAKRGYLLEIDSDLIPSGALDIDTFSMQRMDIFMQQTGLTYREVLELLDCYYINPLVSGSRRLYVDATDPSSCVLYKTQIAGLVVTDLDVIHRFVRLKRRFGFSYYELDQVLTMMGLAAGALFTDHVLITLAQLKRLKEILGCTVEDLLPFWGNIAYMPYSSYAGDNPQRLMTQYEKYFRNQAVVPNFEQIADYPFPADMEDWIGGSAEAMEYSTLKYILAAFRIDEKSYDYLTAYFLNHSELSGIFTDTVMSGRIDFSYNNVRQLYREFFFARFLQISVVDWCYIRSWLMQTGSGMTVINPFSFNLSDYHLKNVFAFIKAVKTIRNAQENTAAIEYLFYDKLAEKDKETVLKTLDTQYLELQQLLTAQNTSVLNEEGLADAVLLLNKFSLIFKPADAEFLINYVGGLSGKDELTFTSEDKETFQELLPGDLNPETVDEYTLQLIGDPDATPDPEPYTLDDVNDRLTLLNTIYLPLIYKSVVRSYLSVTHGTDMAVTEALLADWIKYKDEDETEWSAYDVIISNAYINPEDEEEEQESVRIILMKFSKAAALIVANNLNLDEVNFFLNPACILKLGTCNVANLPVTQTLDNPAYDEDTILRKQWYNLIHWFQVRELFDRSPSGIDKVLSSVFSLASSADDNDKKETWFTAMQFALQSTEEDLEVLVGPGDDALTNGILNFNFDTSGSTPLAYLQAVNYFKLFACYEVKSSLQTNMEGCNKITYDSVLHKHNYDIVPNPQWQRSADYAVKAVQAKYSYEGWLDACQPVNDILRIERRDALVAYILANAPEIYAATWYTANDIYETLMIDVEVMPIVTTSRIKQAISTVQVFIERCILQKEYTLNADGSLGNLLTLDSIFINQWQNWRKWYRIWEANRKIFVYPENWIEPELRDNKSPFFKELEKFTKQNEITLDTMETAYRTYLERLQEVADLDIVAHLTDTVEQNGRVLDEVVHVWGRTRSIPATYYHRYRKEGIWTAWEKIEVQIDGDQFTTVKYKGTVRLYWISFLTQSENNKLGGADESGEEEVADSYYKIDLNWIELKNDKWLSKKTGTNSINTIPYGSMTGYELSKLFNTQVQNPSSLLPDYIYDKKTFSDSFNYLKESAMIHSRIDPNTGDLQIILQTFTKGISTSSYINYFEYTHSEYKTIAGFDVNKYNKMREFGTKFNFVEDLYNAYKTFGTIRTNTGIFTIKNNKVHAEYPRTDGFYTFYNYLTDETSVYNLLPAGSEYIYNKDLNYGFYHITGSRREFTKLLNRSPEFQHVPSPDKYVVYPRNLKRGRDIFVDMPRFFYKDYKNLFFVENLKLNISVLLGPVDTGGVYGPVSPTLSPAHTRVLLSDARLSSGISGITFPVTAQNIITANAALPSNNSPMQFSLNPDPPVQATADISRYRFTSFNYTCIEELLDYMDKGGIEGLLNRINQAILAERNQIEFEDTYVPTAFVLEYKPYARILPENRVYPKGNLVFDYDDPNAIYNWELFYHIPMYIANKLMQDQKFAEAMQWFHFIFNPSNTDTTQDTNPARRYWNLYPFRKAETPTIDAILSDNNLLQAVQRWANNPFKPHLVAQTRISAYMQNTVMKYLDNLIEWGDQLFRRDTAESINEAMVLYMSAAQLLGKAPQRIPQRAAAAPYSFSDLNLNAFSNAMVPIETVLAPTGMTQNVSNTGNGYTMFYFCIPHNDMLLDYWNLVADRLFKIRNSQNIDGVERILALFEPPIDPAMLVKAAASGMSIADAVNNMYAPMPQYRFSILVQKAAEIAQEVKGLGGSLLAALEKKDAEYLANLRSTQEIAVLQAGKDVKVQQVKEAEVQLAALQEQKKLVETRKAYYDNLIETGWNTFEQTQLENMQQGIPLKESANDLQNMANTLGAIPQLKIAAPTSAGTEFGGLHVSTIIGAIATKMNGNASILDIKGSMAGIKGGYARREQEWKFQQKLAGNELKQVDRQILAAEIRKSIADFEFKNYELQLSNAVAVNEAMQNKFTNEELYDWMIGEISISYFQMYKLAHDVAKKAERAYNFELGKQNNPASFIQFGYWDSLKKGLLAGDKLILDIKRMDAAYLDNNTRLLEMTRNVSLAAFAPELLRQLKTTSKVDLEFPEWLFDMDNPGQYMRRIKSVSVSIPCIAGPYTTVTAQLNLISSQYRVKTTAEAEEFDDDNNFVFLTGGGQSIATSSAQNDSGLFELNFKDERYLPFEGAGLISRWSLSLPSKYASYDINSIKDVIFHFKYTAKYDGRLAITANTVLDEKISLIPPPTPPEPSVPVLKMMSSLHHEFSNEWNLYAGKWPANNTVPMEFILGKSRFPVFAKGYIIKIRGIRFYFKNKRAFSPAPKLDIEGLGTIAPLTIDGGAAGIDVLDNPVSVDAGLPLVKIKLIDGSTPHNIDYYCEDIQVLITYTLEE